MKRRMRSLCQTEDRFEDVISDDSPAAFEMMKIDELHRCDVPRILPQL